MTNQYRYAEQDGQATVAFTYGGELRLASTGTMFFDRIVESLRKGDYHQASRLTEDAQKYVAAELSTIGAEVDVDTDEVRFNGRVLDNSITQAIRRFARAGQSFDALANFLRKIMANPSENSRNQLFDWLRDRDFTILQDGDFIAYKGLTSDGGSVHAGGGYVDGVYVHGSIPNKPGTTITLDRSLVEDNSSVGCASGLHAGAWEYASTFGNGVTAKVSINPAHVVSVPSDCNAQKLRVCEYHVIEYVNAPSDKLVDDAPAWGDPGFGWVDDSDEEFWEDSSVDGYSW